MVEELGASERRACRVIGQHRSTHHALSMAYGAVSCLDEAGNFDRERWAELREEFETHVVED